MTSYSCHFVTMPAACLSRIRMAAQTDASWRMCGKEYCCIRCASHDTRGGSLQYEFFFPLATSSTWHVNRFVCGRLPSGRTEVLVWIPKARAERIHYLPTREPSYQFRIYNKGKELFFFLEIIAFSTLFYVIPHPNRDPVSLTIQLIDGFKVTRTLTTAVETATCFFISRLDLSSATARGATWS